MYLLAYLRSDYFSEVVSRIAEARANIPKVNRDELSELNIPIPPKPLQEKFADVSVAAVRKSALLFEAHRQAEHLFQTLLHEAFNND